MTSGYPWTAWLFWIGGAVLALSGLILFYWAMFKDRARGRKRCPKCWYDLSGIAAADVDFPITCSECGKRIPREQKLYKTRRRKRWALVALLGILAAGWLSLMPKVDRDGWWSIVPNRVLIAGLPFAHDIDDFWCKELARRMQLSKGFRQPKYYSRFGRPDYKLSKDEWRSVFERCVAGDWRARPLSEAWQRKYGELIHVWTFVSWNQDPVPKSVESILLALPPKISVKHRPSWPQGVPFYVEFSMTTWWPTDAHTRAQVTARLPGSTPFIMERPYDPYGFLAPAEFDGDAIMFDITVDDPRPDDARGAPALIESVRVPVNVRGSLAGHIRPVSSPGMDAAMSGMSMTIAPGKLEPDSRSIETSLFKNIAIGARFDYMHDGQIVCSQSNYWRGGDSMWLFRPGETSGDFHRVFDAKPGETWTVRIRSDPLLGLRVFDCDQYWEGDVTIPLTITAR